MKCPCCCSEIDDVPVEALREIMLSPQQKLVFSLLLRRYPQQVHREAIIETLFGHRMDGGPLTAKTLASVILAQLRDRLKDYGWTITSSNNTGGPGNHGVYYLRKQGS